MSNAIFAKAATIRSKIEAAGLRVGDLITSTNRNGDHSAYFACEGGARVRVSDHDTMCEDSYKWWAGSDDDAVRAFVRRRLWNMAVSDELTIIRQRADARAAAARKAAYDQQAEAADANRALLIAAGFDPAAMTSNQRRKVARDLRRAAA